MRTIVLSAPGREPQSRAMLNNLRHQNPGEHYHVLRPPAGDPIGSFWWLLDCAAAAGGDLLALEDDISTARNFLAYAAGWRCPSMTSFCFMGAQGTEQGRPQSPETFGGNQALWFPAPLVAKLAAREPLRLPGWLQDNALAHELQVLGECVYYHRPSLVQHLEGPSIAAPGRRWHPHAIDFPGEAFDCLSLP